MCRLDSRPSQHNITGYDFDALIHAFHEEPFYVGIHIRNNSWTSTKPFGGFIRNIRFNDQVQSIDQVELKGSLEIETCPSDLTFPSDTGPLLLGENVTFDDNIRIIFELKITDCPECCSTSAVVLSAVSEDSHLIMEIVENILHVKMKSQEREEVLKLAAIFDYHLCDGNWHKSIFLKSQFKILLF